MTKGHLLVIEDELEIRELIRILLIRQGYQVSAFGSVEEVKDRWERDGFFSFDLLILDWMLPGQTGLDFLSEFRTNDRFIATPVLMVTAKAEASEIISGLENGADDYLVKPFEGAVLLARVKALLRRGSQKETDRTVDWDGLNINLESYEASLDGEKLALTPTEFKLLSIMAKNRGKVFTREQLVQSVQGDGVNVVGRTVDTHIFSLRKKLGDLGERIETLRGIGYGMRDSERNP